MLTPVFRTIALAISAASLFSAVEPSVNTSIVTINLVALDPRGQVVQDLHPDELRVFDAGQPRPIAFFREIGGEPWNPPSLGPQQVSNRGGAFAPRSTVVILDLFNEVFAAQAQDAEGLIHALESLHNADSLFLYILGVDGQLRPVHGIPFDLHFHNDRPSGEPWTANIKALMKPVLAKSVGSPRPSITLSDHANLTFQALDSVAVQLSRIAGRKNIVWIDSGDSPGIRFKAVPPRALSAHSTNYSHQFKVLNDRLNSFGEVFFELRPFSVIDAIISAEGAATMDRLVESTGGSADDGIDVEILIERALSEARTSYQLGYEEPLENRDGKLHRTRVETTRKAVRLQTQESYVAAPEPREADATAVASAAIPPSDRTDIGLHGVLVPDPKSAGAVELQLLINARDLALVQANGEYRGHLRLIMVGYAKSGRPMEPPIASFKIAIRHSEADHRNRLDAGILLKQRITMGKTMTRVRAIVLDETSKSIGTLSFPLETRTTAATGYGGPDNP